jgi:hypothetical protein
MKNNSNFAEVLMNIEELEFNSYKNIKINNIIAWQIIKPSVYYYLLKQQSSINEKRNQPLSKIPHISVYKIIFQLFYFIKIMIFTPKPENKFPTLIFTNSKARNYKNKEGKLMNIWLDGFIHKSIITNYYLIEDREKVLDNSYLKLSLNSSSILFFINIVKYIAIKICSIVKFKKAKLINNILEKHSINVPIEVLIKSIVQFKMEYLIFKILLKKINPNLILTYDNLATGFMAACNHLHINIIDVQHGVIGKYYPSYQYSNKLAACKKNLSLPNKIATFGLLEKDELLKRKFWTNDEVSMAGSFILDYNKTLSKNEQTSDVLIITENLPDFNYLNVFEELFKLPISIDIIISFHPFEDNNVKNSILELIKNKPNIRALSKDQNTYYGISIAKIVIGSYSTCLLEALHLGRKIITIKYNVNNSSIFSYYSNSELIKMINHCDLENLNEIILDLLISEEKNMHKENFLFAEDFLIENTKIIQSLLS